MEKNNFKIPVKKNPGEHSFTLVETVIALAIMAFLIVNVASVQGNSVLFADYGRHITNATWLARRVMSQVEYYWQNYPFDQLLYEKQGIEFKLDDENQPSEYKYNLQLREWEFPLSKLLGGPQPTEDEEGGGAPAEAPDSDAGAGGANGQGSDDMIETVVKQVFGDEPVFITANVEVCWNEGASDNCTKLISLLVNQKKVDEAIVRFKPAYDKFINKDKKDKKNEKKKTNPNSTKGKRTTPSG